MTSADPGVDGGVPSGGPLRAFALALAMRDGPSVGRARSTLVADIGHEATVEAAATAAHFCAVNRIAEATGTHLDETTAGFAERGLADLDLSALHKPDDPSGALHKPDDASGALHKPDDASGE